MQQVREFVSASSSSAQQADELKHLHKAEQNQLLRDAGMAIPGSLKPGAALAFKCDLHLPWYLLRKLRRWLSSFGIRFESEAIMRQQVCADLPFELVAEHVPMTEKSGAITMKPMFRFEDLEKVSNALPESAPKSRFSVLACRHTS